MVKTNNLDLFFGLQLANRVCCPNTDLRHTTATLQKHHSKALEEKDKVRSTIAGTPLIAAHCWHVLRRYSSARQSAHSE